MSKIHKFRGPDGRIHKVRGPEDATIEQLLAVLQNKPVESQKARTFAQGLTFGFGDEIEAGIRSAFSGDEYSEIRDRIRGQLKDYADQNGGEALALEIAGSAIPSLVAQFVPALGQSATAANMSRLATMANRMKKAAQIGLAEGALAGAGYSEGDSVGEVAQDVAMGAALGGTIAPVAGEAVRKGVTSLGDIIATASERLGKKGATAVEQELRKIVKATGKTEEEVISDIVEGRLITDNRTLAATIRALSSKSDEAKNILTESYERRGPQTLQDLRDARDLSLTGVAGEPPNIAALSDFADEQDMVRSLYNQAKQGSEVASPEVQQIISVIDEMMPNLTRAVKRSSEAINKAGRTEIKADPIMGRQAKVIGDDSLKPTIEQAENILRQIKREIDAFYKSGGSADIEGKYGVNIDALNQIKDALQNAIDNSSPSMRQAREAAAKRFGEIESFESGRRMARKPSDMQEEMMMDLSNKRDLSEQDMARLRQGAATSLRSRIGTPSEFSDVRAIAKTDSPQSNLLDLVGAEDTAELRIKAQLADDVNVMRGIIKPTSGSITQFAAEASERFGQNVNPTEILSALNGDVATWLNLGTKVAKGLFKGGLSEDEYAELARLLVSEDPTIIRRALLGDATNQEISSQISKIAAKYGIIASDVTRRAVAQQASQE